MLNAESNAASDPHRELANRDTRSSDRKALMALMPAILDMKNGDT